MVAARPTRVAVVDDHRSFADAVAMAIQSQVDLQCIGTASTVKEAMRLVGEHAPHVVLMDVQLPDGDGVVATEQLRSHRPETRIIVLSAHADPSVMAAAARAGASGFVPKESPLDEVMDAIRTVSEGGMVVDRSTLATVLDHVPALERHEERDPGLWKLTPRELEVLQLMSEALAPKSIARKLGISPHTCRGYVKSILSKLGVHSQLEAVVTAVRLGLFASHGLVSWKVISPRNLG